MMKFYWHLSALALLCIMGSSSLVSAQADHSGNFKLTINKKTNDGNERIQLNGEKAAQFDMIKFLNENSDADIYIFGSSSSDKERIRYQFKSQELKNTADCTTYCEKVISLKKVPFLGVAMQVSPDFNGVQTTRIVNETAAQTAGLMADDIITHIDGNEIRSNCDLSVLISSYEVGDAIDIKIIRGEEDLVNKAVLGERITKVISWEPCCNTSQEPMNLATIEHQDDWNTALNVFPNPTSGLSQFQYKSDSKAPISVVITDVSGRQVYQDDISSFDGYIEQYIDLTNESSGMYFLNIIQGKHSEVSKIMLQRD